MERVQANVENGHGSPCHYREYWQDRYARTMRERAVCQMFPTIERAARAAPNPNGNRSAERTLRVLDVGCGDGRFGEWVAERFGVVVSGVDAFAWKGAYKRLWRFAVCDAEVVSQTALKWGFFDLALLITVLPFVQDYRKVFEELTWVTPYVLVVENMQDPAPSWQRGLDYKQHIPLSECIAGAGALGWEPRVVKGVNVFDRALFVHSPKFLYPLTYAATRGGDALAVWLYARGRLAERHVRYHAVLFENQRWDTVMERWAARKQQ